MYDIKTILEPTTLAEALSSYQDNPNLKLIAGGTDVLINLHHHYIEDAELLSLRNIKGLDEVKVLEDGTISIGAMTSFTTIFRNEIIRKYVNALNQGAVSMGGPQIRNIATIGGNICNGAVSADSIPALFAFNANLVLKRIDSERIVPIQDFYEGPGKVRLLDSEILTEVLISKENYQNMRSHFIKFSNRKAMDIAMLSVACCCNIEKGVFKDIRIALGVSAPVPVRCVEAEVFALEKKVDEETIQKIAKLALCSAKPRDSWRGSKAYREHLIEVLTERAIKQAGGLYEGN